MTLDEYRLQQLLGNFNNQSGIVGTNAANSMINTADILNQYNIPNLQNRNLADFIISKNQMSNLYNTDDTASFFGPTIFQPSNLPVNNSGIKSVSLGFDTSTGVANEPDVIGTFKGEDVYKSDDGVNVYKYKGDTYVAPYLDEDQKEPSGIAKFLRAALGYLIPGANLFMGDRSALQGIRSLNQKLRNTDFGKSKTLVEYLQRREARKDTKRLETVGKQLQQAAERGGGYQKTSREQNVSRTASRRSDKGLGQGGVYGL